MCSQGVQGTALAQVEGEGKALGGVAALVDLGIALPGLAVAWKVVDPALEVDQDVGQVAY